MLKELAHHGPNLFDDGWGCSTTEKGSRLASFFVQLSVIISAIEIPAAAITFYLVRATAIAHNVRGHYAAPHSSLFTNE